MKGSKKSNETKREYECIVTRAKEIKEGTVSFDMEVNGVKVYGCWYKEGTSSNGKEYQIVDLPQEKEYQIVDLSQKKGNGRKYYSIAWFPMSKEVRENIIEQLQKMV